MFNFINKRNNIQFEISFFYIIYSCKILSETLFEIFHKEYTNEVFYTDFSIDTIEQKKLQFSLDELTFRMRTIQHLPQLLQEHYYISIAVANKNTAGNVNIAPAARDSPADPIV